MQVANTLRLNIYLGQLAIKVLLHSIWNTKLHFITIQASKPNSRTKSPLPSCRVFMYIIQCQMILMSAKQLRKR